MCTRNRPEQLRETLDRLGVQADLPVLVVDQSDAPDPTLAERSAGGPLRVLLDSGRGLSRARNLAVGSLKEEDWIVFIDDDCHVDEGFADDLRAALRAHPRAAFVSPHVAAPEGGADGLLVSAFPVEQEVIRQGRWTPPWTVGFGVCFAVRREWVERLGGWDERLGAGTTPFPAAEDMDFNYRLLKSGGIAVATPAVCVLHAQWRDPPEMVKLFEGYARAAAGFSCKHVLGGDPVGGLWLWGLEAHAALRMLASAVRRRSWLRARVGAARVRGQIAGTVLGLRASW